MTELTIGMPVYNDIDFISKSIESILAQTYTNFIIIISDDCSTDGSSEICEKFVEKDSRIQYIRQKKNIGISNNMRFLLEQAHTAYFMWAGDDDLLAPTFIEQLIHNLKFNKNAILAFCTFAYINEKDEVINEPINYDYQNNDYVKRLMRFIKNDNDIMGYGIFCTEKIKDVQFPNWWWPNKKTPYNNIFPSLCYYLTKGDYVHQKGKPLFFKREKTLLKTNYETTVSRNGTLQLINFVIRRFYLVCFSSKMISKASNIFIAILFFPILLWYWFFLDVASEIKKSTQNKFINKK